MAYTVYLKSTPFDNIYYKINAMYKIKGIGISLVDYNPREICYISFYKIKLKKITVKKLKFHLYRNSLKMVKWKSIKKS